MMKKIKSSIALVALSTLMFTAFVALKPEGGYKAGDTADDFKLKNVNSKMVSLADYKTAKGFIVVFTCNHCPFAQAYQDRVIALDKKYSAKGYPVIAINPNDAASVPDDSFENMIVRAKEKNFTFPYLYDETQEVARKYGAARTPHVFVLAKDGGKLVVKYIGAIDDNADDASAVKDKYVETAVDALLAGKPVKENFTKAIGCSIKWKKS